MGFNFGYTNILHFQVYGWDLSLSLLGIGVKQESCIHMSEHICIHEIKVVICLFLIRYPSFLLRSGDPSIKKALFRLYSTFKRDIPVSNFFFMNVNGG
jgi:hypothetical protein